MSYKFELEHMRASVKDGKRYARVRAIANGTDSYRSVFTKHARESFISQLKSNTVKTNALHRSMIMRNMEKYLRDRQSKSYGDEKQDVETLLQSIPATNFPVGLVEDAYFVDDNIVEAIIVENSDLKLLGGEDAEYLEATWNMVESGALGGVSVIFNEIKTYKDGDVEYIDDLKVNGLDFVDRPSHKDTRVIDTFMRAMQDENFAKEKPEMTNEGNEPATPVAKETPQVVDVDKIEEKIMAKIQADADKKALEATQSEQEKALADKESENEALKAELAQVKSEKEEAMRLAEDATKVASETASRVDNPFAESAKKKVEQANNPLDGLSVAELMALKAKAQAN